MADQQRKAIAVYDTIFGRHVTYSNSAVWGDRKAEAFVRKDAFLAMTPDTTGDLSIWNIWLCGTLPESRRRGKFTALLKEALAKRPSVTTITLRLDKRQSPELYNWAFKRHLRVHELPNGETAFAIARDRLASS